MEPRAKQFLKSLLDPQQAWLPLQSKVLQMKTYSNLLVYPANKRVKETQIKWSHCKEKIHLITDLSLKVTLGCTMSTYLTLQVPLVG